MIGRRSSKAVENDAEKQKGFDAFELRLGDVMRGERATMGKSLLDVQRELRIKAAYIAAIENCDPGAFDTPGFIAGYVRSYARYLNMDPDECFATFCAESGFEVHHGMSAGASSKRMTSREDRLSSPTGGDIFKSPSTPFIPAGEAFLSNIEPRAIGSIFVLVALIAGIGYGGWSVLQEVQRVQVAPVDQSPSSLADFEEQTGVDITSSDIKERRTNATIDVEDRNAALDRLYRPQALDVPVLTARDAPIATIDPTKSGAFADQSAFGTAQVDEIQIETPPAIAMQAPPVPKVVEDIGPTIRMVAAYPSWVRVRSVEGNTLFEGIMQAGDMWDVPATEEAPTLRTGESGAIYFAMGTECYGPVGSSGEVTSGLQLAMAALSDKLDVVIPTEDGDSAFDRMFADLRQLDPGRLSKLPCQTN